MEFLVLPPDSVIHLLMELIVAPCGSQSMNVCSEVVMSGTRGSMGHHLVDALHVLQT